MKVSVLIVTYNEASNLPKCLASVAWCNDIVVIDSYSNDATVAIAESFGARVLCRKFDDFANQRNFGLTSGNLRCEWVLHLDADEFVTPTFKVRLEQLSAPSDVVGFRVPSKLIMHDTWLRFAGMYPTYQVRLGHRDRLRFKQVGHGQREDAPAERIGTFDEPYLHYNFSHGLSGWLRKHVKYAEDEAKLIARARRGEKRPAEQFAGTDSTTRRRAVKRLTYHMPLIIRPGARFFYVAIWRGGFRDGRYGIFYAFMLSVYEGMIAILAAELLLREAAREYSDKKKT